MKLGTLKLIIGFTLTGLHILAIALCFLWLRDHMSPSDFQVTALILAPVTTTYAMSYLKDVTKHRFAKRATAEVGGHVSVEYAVLSILFTSIFSLSVIYLIYDFGDGQMSSDDLKIYIGYIEVVLGAFVGFVVGTLYGAGD